MAKKRLTIAEIAALAGVSTATVSRVLNGKKDVSLKTRLKIQRIIADHGYQPHALARSLSLKKTYNLGLIIPHTAEYLFSFPYFSELIRGISHHANAQGYRLLLATASSERSSADTYETVLYGAVDGLIVVDIKVQDERLKWLEREQIPFVLVGRPFQRSTMSCVDSDNVGGAYQATRYLLELGYEEVWLINGPAEHTVSVYREQGYQRALQEAGHSSGERVLYGPFTVEGGYALAQEVLRRRSHLATKAKQKGFGLLAASDLQACGAILALKEAGLAVGREVSVIGFDDVPLARVFDPPLTTVRQPIFEIGMEAARSLIRRIERPEAPPLQTVFPTELIVRKSTRSSP
jgi:DNA-binding LacI/PurR family transcriptional regulator